MKQGSTGKVSRILTSTMLLVASVSLVINSSGKLLAATPDCTPPPSGLVAWWPGEGDANDAVGDINGTLQGEATFATGKVGQNFSFNASGQSSIHLSYNPTLINSNYTVEAWINPSAQVTGGIGQTLIFGQSFGHVQLVVRTGTTGVKVAFQFGVNHYSFYGVQSTIQIPIGQFTHIAGTWDGTTLRLYINGVLNAQSTPGTSPVDSGCDFFIGGFNSPEAGSCQYVGQFFQGSVDELSLYNRALSTNEIAAIYNAGSAGKCLPVEPMVIAGPITNSANGHVYYLLGGNTWTESEAEAVQLGGHLVTINDAVENIWVQSTFGGGGTRALWIGLNDAASEGNFTWISGDPSSYRNWSSGEPNNYGGYENYAYIGYPTFSDGTWNDQPDSGYNPVSGADNRPYMHGVVEIPFNAIPNPPVITDFSPKSGTNGMTVTLTGTNFSPAAANNIVYFGAVRANVLAATTSSLTAIVPPGATFAPITVTVNNLTAFAPAPFLPTFLAGGTFGASSLSGPTNLSAGSGPARAVFGDLDGDGKPDLVVANVYDGSVWIYRNISSAGSLTKNSFGTPVIFTIGGGSDSLFGLTLADLDGDGKLDIVTANRNLNIVSIFKNLSSPGNLTTNTFAARVDLPVAGNPAGVAAGDLDADGKPEIITVNQGGNSVSVLRNLTSPGHITTNSFAAAVNFATGSSPFGVVVSDIDGDGRPDLATANNPSSSTVSVLRNTSSLGNLSFASRIDLPGLGSGGSVAAGDLDGDGKLDLVIGSQSSGQAVSVYRNTSTPGSIAFAANVNFPTGGWANAVALGDLDGNGKPDLVAVVQLPSHLSIFQNVSTPGSLTAGSFAARIDCPAGWNPNGLAVGDLDGDGRTDIAFGNAYDANISIYRNVVASQTPPVITQQPTNQSVIVGDQVAFGVTATGTLPITYLWKFNGNPISGATNSTLVLSDVQFAQAGNYSVTISNQAGSTNSINASLAVLVPDCTPPPVGLVAWWSAENNALDSVGTNHGVLQGGITFAAGKVGQAFAFTNSNATVVVPASPSLNVGSSSGLTLEAWINPTDVTQTHPLFEWNNSSYWGVHFHIAPGQPSSGTPGPGQLYANVVDSSGFWHQLGSSGGVVASNVFQHVALTYDKASGIARIYCNGQIVSQKYLGSFTPLTTYNLYIGRRPAPSGEIDNFAGLMDEPSVYNRALSTNEIAAIYAARGAGKCPLPPTVLNVTPPSWHVNEGATVAYSATAVGSPVLGYQWQHNGSDIAGATGATLILSNVVYAQAGNYSVVVSNLAGMTSSNVTLDVNRAPIADASATEMLAISPNNSNAVVVLDGSHSSDPDGDALTYAWFHTGDALPFATGIVATPTLPLGTNQLTLSVNDGMASGTQAFAVEVITTSQAVDRLVALVQSGSGNTQPLVASLQAALAAIDRSQPTTAINQLEAFINKVHAQLEPSDPALAAQLIADAQAIIDALNGGGSVVATTVEISSFSHGHGAKSHLKVKGATGRVYVVETSTNMVDWVPVGVASQNADGEYDFDDTQTQEAGTRFYRVVSPK